MRQHKFNLLVAVFLLAALIQPVSAFAAVAQTKARPIMEDLKDIYSRYSNYLDTQWVGDSWNYFVPSRHYNEQEYNSFDNLRLQTTLAAFYKFRNDGPARQKVRRALLNALIELPYRRPNAVPGPAGEHISTLSFSDAIGFYLALRILQDRSDLFSDEERGVMISNIKTAYPWVLKAKDTENRVLLSAAYCLAILDSPIIAFSQEEKDGYRKIIKDKVAIGLRSIGQDGFYREGKERVFSLHYHLLAADTLFFIGRVLAKEQYVKIAKQMFVKVHQHYQLGYLNANGAGRPGGIGLQAVLLRALSEKFFNSKDWQLLPSCFGRT